MAYETLGLPLLRDTIKLDPCYFGSISRSLAEKYLCDRGTCEGTFLIREGDDGYRLSVLEWRAGNCSVFHYKIEQKSNKTYCIDPHITFPTVTNLLSFYKRKHTDMNQPLTVPCPKTDPQPPVSDIDFEHKDINRDALTLKSQLVTGKFVDIWKGKLTSLDDHVIVKIGTDAENSRKFLIEEARAITALRHKNVVRLLGISSNKELCVVLEHHANRDLLDYLLRNDTYAISDATRLRFAQEVASGLHHVSRMNYVHRNVRAANVLLTNDLACKLSGFGFAAKLDNDGNYYAKEDDKSFNPVMVRWMALEATQSQRFSTCSDVWSFACLLNEIYTDGEAPFSGVLAPHVQQKVMAGYRSPKPLGLPDALYSLMLKCWYPEPKMRPTFPNLQDVLEQLQQPPRTEKEPMPLSSPPPTPDKLSPSGGKTVWRYINLKSIKRKK